LVIDDPLEEILMGDDALVRLGLDPERPRMASHKLFKVFPRQPEDDHLHIIIQQPPPDRALSVVIAILPSMLMDGIYILSHSAVAELRRKNDTLFKCLQVKVLQLQFWTQEDVRDNLGGGIFFNNGDNRTCQILAEIEARMAQRRTYSVSPFHI